MKKRILTLLILAVVMLFGAGCGCSSCACDSCGGISTAPESVEESFESETQSAEEGLGSESQTSEESSEGETHVHSFIITGSNDTHHFKECSCGERIEEEHSFSAWFSFTVQELNWEVLTRCCLECKIVQYQKEGEETVYSSVAFQEKIDDLGLTGVHIHKNITCLEGKQPTCTQDGYAYQIQCVDCEEILYTESLPALGHEWAALESDHPCLEGQVCQRCNKTESEYNHNYKEIEYTPPTCTQDGVEKLKCTKCGDEKTEILNASHDYVYYTQASTCEQNGIKITACNQCDLWEEDSIPTIGHISFVLAYNEQEHIKACLICEEEILREGHEYSITFATDSDIEGDTILYTTTFYLVCLQCSFSKEVGNDVVEYPIIDVGEIPPFVPEDIYWFELIDPNDITGVEYIIGRIDLDNPILDDTISPLCHSKIVVYNEDEHIEKCYYCGEVFRREEHTLEVNATTTRTISGRTASYTTVFYYECNGFDGKCGYQEEITRDTIYIPLGEDTGVATIEYEYEITQPTCTEEGEFIVKNKATGEEISSTAIPMIDHSYTIENNDSTQHWTECICGLTTAKETHTMVDSICSGCGYIQTYVRVNKDKNPNVEGEYILFGSYPQTKVTDSTLASTLNSAAGTLPTNANSQAWTSYKYYQGTGDLGSQSNTTDYMWYQDITYGGEKFRGVYFTSYRPYLTNYVSGTGYIMQKENGYNISTVYWFQYEPIQWRILSEENSSALILCEMLIDSQEFYHTSNNREINGQTIYANNYAESNIRAWLNDNFYNTAFDSLQKQLIQLTTVDNSASTTSSASNPYACENTVDNIFLLSYQDMINTEYGFNANANAKDAARQKGATDYALCQGVEMSASETELFGFNKGVWWLRSPSDASDHQACDIFGSGYSYDISRVWHTIYGVCPALYIQL